MNDTGDENSTNMFIGNINPKVSGQDQKYRFVKMTHNIFNIFNAQNFPPMKYTAEYLIC